VAAGEHRDQQLLDDLVLAHDHFGQFVPELVVGFRQFLDGLDIVIGEHYFSNALE
jgi:hypothetical protein